MPSRILALSLLALVLVCAASPARAAEKVAVLSVNASGGFDPSRLPLVEEVLLAELSRGGAFEVVGRSDIASLLGFEREKQLLGCDENASCTAEIAGALGVGLIVTADVGRLGRLGVFTLKLIDAENARVRSRAMARFEDDAQLADAIAQATREVIGAPAKAPAPAASVSSGPAPAAPAAGSARPAWKNPWVIAAGLGLGLAIAGGGAYGVYTLKDHPSVYVIRW